MINFNRQLIETVRRALVQADAPPELVKRLSGEIAFSVALLIDDVAGFEAGGQAASPVLPFLIGDGELELSGGNIWVHEYIDRLLPKVFPDSKAHNSAAVGKPAA